MENRLRLRIDKIEFEAEGSADVIEKEREIFMQVFLPVAVDAIIKMHTPSHTNDVNEMTERKEIPSISETKKRENIVVGNDRAATDYSQLNLVAYLKTKGTLTEQDFTLFAAYFDEQKNGKEYFTMEDVKRYYSEARRTKPSNISMSLNRLAEKGYIMDADKIVQKSPKPYVISSEGIKFINKFTPKNETEKSFVKSPKYSAKIDSRYVNVNIDNLNLNRYPEIKSLKDFKSKMMMVLYIITTEKAGEWFTTTDVMYLLTDIFGEAATKDQVNGVFRREKLWFLVRKVDENKRDSQRKLLNKGIEYAESFLASALAHKE